MKIISKIKTKYIELPEALKASIWFLVCSFMQKGISVITTPVFTRLLSSEEFGQYNEFNSWLGIVGVIVTLWIFNGVYTQGLVKFESERNKFSSSLQGLTLALVLFWTAIYICFHNFWNQIMKISTTQAILMLIMIWASAVFNFWAAEQRVILKYKLLVIVTILVSIAKPVLSIILIYISDDKVTARILGLTLAEVIGYTWMFVSQVKKGKKLVDWKIWKYALLFNIPLIPHYLAQNILVSSDRIMIGRMVGSSEAGIYSLAYSIAQIMILFNTALTQTISPWIYKKIKDRDPLKISNIAYGSLAFIALVNVFLIALAPEAVKIFAPAEYYDAIWAIPPVAMSVFFQFAYSFFACFEFYYEKTGFITLATIISAVFNLGLNYVCINQFGYIAAGYTTLFCYIIQFTCHYIMMQKVCNMHLDGVVVYKPSVMIGMIFVFFVVGFGFMFTYNYPIIRYSFVVIAIILVIIKRKAIIEFIKMLMRNKRESKKA